MPQVPNLLQQRQRDHVRNVSYIELLLVIVFTSVLLFSFATHDLFDALKKIVQQEGQIDEANKTLADQMARVNKADKELAELRPLADPHALSRLRNVQSLTAEERRLSKRVERLKAEQDQIQRSKQTREKLEKEIAVLNERLRDAQNRSDFLKRQNRREREAEGKDNPFGRPPCWIAGGKVVKTFDIFITNRGFRIVGSWPEGFDAKARSVPEVMAMNNRKLTVEQFQLLAGSLDQLGRKNDCTYYARTRSDTESLSVKEYEVRRILVGRYFYPF